MRLMPSGAVRSESALGSEFAQRGAARVLQALAVLRAKRLKAIFDSSQSGASRRACSVRRLSAGPRAPGEHDPGFTAEPVIVAGRMLHAVGDHAQQIVSILAWVFMLSVPAAPTTVTVLRSRACRVRRAKAPRAHCFILGAAEAVLAGWP